MSYHSKRVEKQRRKFKRMLYQENIPYLEYPNAGYASNRHLR